MEYSPQILWEIIKDALESAVENGDGEELAEVSVEEVTDDLIRCNSDVEDLVAAGATRDDVLKIVGALFDEIVQ